MCFLRNWKGWMECQSYSNVCKIIWIQSFFFFKTLLWESSTFANWAWLFLEWNFACILYAIVFVPSGSTFKGTVGCKSLRMLDLREHLMEQPHFSSWRNRDMARLSVSARVTNLGYQTAIRVFHSWLLSHEITLFRELEVESLLLSYISRPPSNILHLSPFDWLVQS